mmetsp:Transcript_67309/g.161362  ORF Transcript_67309/g.161362 Transcript_67309/m.161362 type:complete len:477 (-) Transcript_67309:81-1511(-)
MLAIGWYDHTPLPDASACPPPRRFGLTALSQRLTGAFDAGLHCDVELRSGNAAAAPTVRAHRAVLRRNPALRVGDSSASSAAAAGGIIVLPAGIAPETLRLMVRLHYLEVEVEDPEPGAKRRAPRSTGDELLDERKALHRKCTEAEVGALEAGFGELLAANWMPLADAVAMGGFTDCRLRLEGSGETVGAHRFVVGGADDGHFFEAAFRWPGQQQQECSCPEIRVPDGLSAQALRALLQLRYGMMEVQLEHILEARHYAELFDWKAETAQCEECLERVLSQAESLDTESLLAVLTHAEESNGLSSKVRVAAVCAAVRQWSRVTEAAEAALPKSRSAELRALSGIRRRDGHVCSDLSEYLHAAADDLEAWERGLALDAPTKAKRQVESSWKHWEQLLLEHGRIFGAENAERWRVRVRQRREAILAERASARGVQLPAGRTWFEPSFEWREVPTGAVCPGGLEFRLDMQTGRNFARLA